MNNLISIVVVGERADWLIWRSLRAARRGQLFAAERGLGSELIVCVGEADEAGRAALRQWQTDNPEDTIIDRPGATEGELRLAGWQRAAGETVIWLSGTELISVNFFYEAWLTLRNESVKTAVHPQFIISSRDGWRGLSNQHREVDARLLLRHDLWPGAGLFSRELLEQSVTKDWAAETALTASWWLNAAAIDFGGTHLVAPGTIGWQRSPFASPLVGRAPLANPLFDNEKVFFYPTVGNLFRLTPGDEGRPTPKSGDWPDGWLKGETRQLAEDVDLTLFPVAARLGPEVSLPRRSAGRLEERWSWLRRQWPPDEHYDHVFLLPWLSVGGAEREILLLIKTLAEQFGRRSLVILTESERVAWLDRLPASATCLVLREHESGLTDQERDWLVLRLLLQRQPAVIHVVAGSDLGWRLLEDHGRELSQRSRLFVTCFYEWRSADGVPQGHAVWALPIAWPYLKGVLTDSVHYQQIMQERFGLPDGFGRCLYAPVEVIPPRWSPAEIAAGRRSKQILWASRLDASKGLDVLAKIAARLSDYTFWVWGESVLNDAPQLVTKLRRLRNVRLMGGYTDFKAVLDRPYALFLYTTSSDGLPNVLLEAVAAGLPVVAPDVGGITEVINNETGYLVPEYFNVEQYVVAIRQATGLTEETARRVERASALIESRHSIKAFREGIERIPGYLAPS